MKVKEFRIQESNVNKGKFVLIAKTEDDKEFVCSGEHYSPTYLTPIELSWDLESEELIEAKRKGLMIGNAQ